MKKQILIKFGEKVREQRKKLGLSQEELSQRTGVYRTYIGMIERAEKNITDVLSNKCFKDFSAVNVLPLIYNEKEMKFKVIVFDLQKAYSSVKKIKFFPPRKIGKKKTFPIYKFFDNKNNYIFEVRYGDAKANALQRGMWTHTEKVEPFFKELLVGDYKINEPLIRLIAKMLVSRKDTHEKILKYFFDFRA